MSLEIAGLPELEVEEPRVALEADIVRTPFYWTSRGQPLFAWWHAARDTSAEYAVVIAAPIGYEQIHAHRSLRHLADALARRGIPALRFDWHGTGDSAGVDEDPDRWPVWQQNLRDALELVQRQFGARHVSVIGLRLGATLAATSLAESDVDHLVLWASVVNGRTFIRELTAIDRTSEIPRQQLPGEPYDLEPSGSVLTEDTTAALSRVDLLQFPAPTCTTCIISRDDSSGDGKLITAYRAADVDVDQISFPGYVEMMTSPHRSQVPQEAIQSIVGWLSERWDLPAETSANTEPTDVCNQAMIISWQSEGRNNAGPNNRVRERALRISEQPNVFGILSEPAIPVSDSRPTVVLLNAGAVYRIGPGRLNVHLARRLAAEGFRCVRMDANGLGDSIASAGNENDSYAATILRDVDLTLQFLQREQLGQTFVLIGLCSGAYFTFQSAVTLENPALIESVLINPLTFYWREGMQISESIDRQVVVQEYFREAAFDPRKWWKLISGQSKTGLSGAARVVADRIKLHTQRWFSRHSSGDSFHRPPYSHPVRDDLSADLDHVMRHQRRLAMFFADSDPGHAILMHKAGRRVKRMQRTGALHVEFVANADHNFSRRAARRDLLAAIANHLAARYGSQ